MTRKAKRETYVTVGNCGLILTSSQINQPPPALVIKRTVFGQGHKGNYRTTSALVGTSYKIRLSLYKNTKNKPI
jgi:hypothetical protein